MRALRALSLSLTLCLLAIPASANTLRLIGFTFDPGEEPGFFWPGGFESVIPYVAYYDPILGFPDPNLNGTMYLTAGPMQSVNVFHDLVSGAIESTYKFIDGQLTLQTNHGTFRAPIVDFTFTVHEPSPACFNNSGECPGTTDYLLLGPGQFSRSLAQYLGVSRRSVGGTFQFYLEGLLPEIPGALERDGDFNIPAASVVVAPEPSLTALTLLAGGMGCLWMRRRTKTFTGTRTLRH